jgi:uracil-DNA glycosylase
MSDTLFTLYKYRFGEKFTLNLSKEKKFEIDFLNGFEFSSPSKCKDCPANIYRQDLPFWIGNVEKDFMVISQDAGKGKGDDFNSVFSIHNVVKNKETYLSNPKHKKYFDYLTALIGNDFYEQTFFTDLIKCAFSTESAIEINSCKCQDDFLTEIEIIKPKIIFLFGSKARNFLQLKVKKLSNSSTKIIHSFNFLINKSKTSKITVYSNDFFAGVVFIDVPQLGENRFSNLCFQKMLDEINLQLKPIKDSLLN